jgi:hypothetical protein
VKLVSICIVLAVVALLDLDLGQLDVKKTILREYLCEVIYMEQPYWFVQQVICNISGHPSWAMPLNKKNNFIWIYI